MRRSGNPAIAQLRKKIMSKKHQFKGANDEHGEALDPFYEMLEILDTEHLLRFRHRLERVGRKKMVEILTAEIDERDEEEKKQHKAEQAQLKKEREEQKKYQI